MPKRDAFSPKGISNRMKAKGLQRLRWYCEMCQKQCRDENGFKCHQTSENHLRQMRIFAENPERIIETYSRDFEKNFLTLLSCRFHTKRVFANDVYREYISDKQHVHMNATRWDSLTCFVQYLGKTGKCVVDETEKGWYVQWIDPCAKKRVVSKDPEDEERAFQREMKKRLKLANERDSSNVEKSTELLRGNQGTTSFSLKARKTTPPTETTIGSSTRRRNNSGWVVPGIVVKIAKKGEHYKRKATVLKVRHPTFDLVDSDITCELGLDDNTVVELSQSDVETVIPGSAGKEVRIVAGGSCLGQVATILSIDQERCRIRVKICQGQPDAGTTLERSYDAVCKRAALE